LRVRKFDGHGNRPFIVMRPSQPRPLTDASPGSGDRPGLRVVRASSIRRGTHTLTLSFEPRRGAFQLFGQRQAVIVPLRGSAQHDELRKPVFSARSDGPLGKTLDL
jgi:hypothetical protein